MGRGLPRRELGPACDWGAPVCPHCCGEAWAGSTIPARGGPAATVEAALPGGSRGRCWGHTEEVHEVAANDLAARPPTSPSPLSPPPEEAQCSRCRCDPLTLHRDGEACSVSNWVTSTAMLLRPRQKTKTCGEREVLSWCPALLPCFIPPCKVTWIFTSPAISRETSAVS